MNLISGKLKQHHYLFNKKALYVTNIQCFLFITCGAASSHPFLSGMFEWVKNRSGIDASKVVQTLQEYGLFLYTLNTKKAVPKSGTAFLAKQRLNAIFWRI